ncbi:MAG: hypothetical protein KJ061_04880 [Vicinamibacteraceae bacterium]|nr:hypothetical protein [Vicinamibacteraceae bacterium]
MHEDLATFVREVVRAMGYSLDVTVEQAEDHVRIALTGSGGEELLRRKGEGLDALQHLVSSAFRRDVKHDQRVVVDYMDFRLNKDRELRQMARFLVQKARDTGIAQEIGPLNSYARRLVHLEVAQHPDMSSESQGDGVVKTVIISKR